MKGNKHLKRVVAIALSATLLFGNLQMSGSPFVVTAAENPAPEQACEHHTHDEACGYDETAGTECTYECPICEVQALIDALPETDGITKENAEEVTEQINAVLEAVKTLDEEQAAMLSMERCTAAADAVSALDTSEPQDEKENDTEKTDTEDNTDTAKLQSCPHHTHDEECGYDVQTGEGCTYECLICKVQALVDALPEADEITAETAEAVEAQLTAIDEAKAALTDEQMDELNMEKYAAAAQALGAVYDTQTLAGDVAAKIGDAEYSTIMKAIEAVTDGTETTISLQKSVTEDVSVTAGKIIILDLNGNTLTGTGASGTPVISNQGTFTLIDSTGGGQLLSAESASSYVLDNQGTMTLGVKDGSNSFTVEAKNANNAASIIRNGWETAGDKPAGTDKASLTIYGGSYTSNTSGSQVIVNKIYGDVAIYDGTFEQMNKATGTYVIYSYGNLEIYGGTFKKDALKFVHYCICTAPSGTDDFPSTAAIYDGSFTVGGGSSARTVNSNNGSSLIVYGGNHSSKILSANLPEGYTCVQGSDKKYYVGNYAAEWNKTGYATIADAIAAITAASENDQTIKLLQDTTESVDIPENMTLTLNLNGNTLTGTAGDHTIDNKGTLKISGKTGSAIIAAGAGKQALYNSGTVSFTSTCAASVSRTEGTNGYVVYNAKGAAMNVGAEVEIRSASANSSCVCNWGTMTLGSKTKAPVIDGGYIAVKNDETGVLNITNAVITGYDQAVQNWNTAEISGGTMNGAVATWAYSDSNGDFAGNTRITGGTINGGQNGSVLACWYTGTYEAKKTPEVFITGGTVNGTMYKGSTSNGSSLTHEENSSKEGIIEVAGGMFDAVVPEELCADGFTPVTTVNSEGKYTVEILSAENAAASVVSADGAATTFYRSLEAAIENAEAGDTVKLLKNAEYSESTVVDLSGVVLDLNGNQITGDNIKTIIFTGTDFTIKNGAFATTGAYALWIGDDPDTSNVTLENLTVEGGINVFNADNVVLRNISAKGHTYYAVWADINGRVTIESGSYETEGVNGLIGAYRGTNPDGKIEIKGGTFTVNDEKFAPAGHDNIEISGGTFSTEVPEEYCASGYHPTDKDANGNYTVCGHKNVTAVQAVEATCDKAGNTAYWHCPDCGRYFSDEALSKEITLEEMVLAAKGHTMTKTEKKAATCTQDGNSEYYHCSTCGKYFADEKGAKEIEKDSWIIKASHTYGEWTVTKEATGTTKGEKQRTCSVCSAVEKAEIPALGHKHGYSSEWEWDGKNHWHECSCGEKTDVAAHTYDDWTVTKQPTADKEGMRETRCTVCGFRVGEPIPATGSGTATSGGAASTGDESMPMVWTALLVMAGAALVIGRKKYNK